ncbi:Uncharacterised protein [Buttiauxella agrestis]|uniref:Uncharacterized protein n=1 Tax=Buttiauxella agrestis TaxID=82977 RepID=A0A381CEI4_9ENTR|nr:hypothetical protein [Buttiauxella agrestis]SUW65473.1 Uncharacterised protein [Buttiauxella agrestis]
MMFKTLLITLLLTVALPALADNAPLSVNTQGTYLPKVNFPVWQLTLTSLENDITIQSITLNRGNCLISMSGRGQNVNKRLEYGQTLSFTTPSNSNFTQCRPLELSVQTSKGAFTFNWK